MITKGLGTYGNAVGVVTPLDHKMAQLGLIVKTAANTIRPGLFWDGNTTIVSGTANMSYNVRAFSAVTSRGATAGCVLLTNDGTYNVATTAAPGSNSRYDVVYIWQREYSLDGADSNPVIGVVPGTAAAVPSVPSLAAFPGAIELARILVPAGVTATNSGTTITQRAPFTATAGGVIPFRSTTERDEGTYLEGQLGWLIDTDQLQQYTGSAWRVTGSRQIVPASATNGSVSASGEVTSTAQSLVRVRTVFDSSYREYEVIFDITLSAATSLQANLASGATDAATAYDTQRFSIVNTTGTASQVLSTTTMIVATPSAAGRLTGTMRLWGPALAASTWWTADVFSSPNPATTSSARLLNAGLHATTTSYDSISFSVASGTLTINSLKVKGI